MQTEQWLDARIALIGRDEIISKTPQELVREQNLALSDAYALRKRATAEKESEGASDSLSKKILHTLKHQPTKDVAELRSALFFKFGDFEASNIDITRAIWSLQKRNLVTFYERKQGRDSILTQIKLTKNGLKEMGVLPTPEMTRPSKVQPSRELKHPSKVGKDMSDPQRHHFVAKGSEVIVTNGATPGVVEIRPAATKLSPKPEYRYDDRPQNQNEKPQSVVRIHAVNFDDFPIIADLMTKEDRLEKYEQAAALLQDMEQDIAYSLLEKIQLTDLEKEVIRFVRAATS